MNQWKNIGQILIENGILTPKILDRVLAISKRHNKRLGWTLEKLELVTGEELASALAQQFNLKMVSNLTRYSYPEKVLQVITCETAIQNFMFPLKLIENNLVMAVSDPTNMKVVGNLAANSGLRITLCIATREEIYKAICKFYLQKTVQKPDKDTVLIVEDEIVSQMFVKDCLIKANYNVLIANNGLEGYNSLISAKPHLIITDKVMPQFDGVALLKAIKAIPEFESVPVILMSDKLSPQDEIRVFEMGFFDYLHKPFDEITLVSRVKRAFKFDEQKYGFF